jgi:hypothetical protein
VNKTNPTIATVLLQNVITVGSSITDSATLTNSFQAGGTVSYNFFSGSTCVGPATVVGSPVTVTTGIVPNSISQTFNTAGPYSWNAVYSGDINNAQATSQCNPLSINKANPSVSATLSANPISKGGLASSSSTLTGGFQAGGTVTYSAFSSADCTGTPTVVSTVTVNSNVVPSSASQTFPADGKFSWKVAYSGDSNNNPATSPCKELDVTSPPLLFVPVSQTINPGSTIHFTVNATDSSWNNITITASGLPSGAVFPGAQSLTGTASSVFSWKPSDPQASADYKVTFTVDDGHGGKTSSQVTIHVSGISQTPPLNNAIPYFVIALVAGTAVVLAAPLLLRRFRK